MNNRLDRNIIMHINHKQTGLMVEKIPGPPWKINRYVRVYAINRLADTLIHTEENSPARGASTPPFTSGSGERRRIGVETDDRGLSFQSYLNTVTRPSQALIAHLEKT